MSTVKYNSAKNLYYNYINKFNDNEIHIKGKKDIYAIKGTIGKGTFGKVKLAYSTIRNPQKKYACKILEQSNMKEKDDKKRCHREMSILLQMNHRNVIKTNEIISDSSRYYIIMDYCEKGELFNHIVEQQHFDEEKSAFYYYQLISGVEYIHSKNICHRDLKPENLLLNEEGELKIIDFGLSNFFTKNSKLLRTPCGSPCYASPEMILGKDYDGFCIDIWSSGIILYAMLCGYLPFEEGENDINNDLLFKNIVECKVDYPEENIGPIAKDLLEKIIVREPQKRITIKQIKNHPFFLLGKEAYCKKRGCVKSRDNLEYNYKSFRRYPTMNFNYKDFDCKYNYKDYSSNNNHNYINVNKKYDSLNVNLNEDLNINFNDIYLKTNYERKNYLNLLDKDIKANKILNTSLNKENENDININQNINYKNITNNFNYKKNSRSVNNRINVNLNINKIIKDDSSRNSKSNNCHYKSTMTLDTKFDKNIEKIFDENIKTAHFTKSIKDFKSTLNFQQYNLLTLNNQESKLYNNYLETNYNSVNANNYQNDNNINQQYMNTEIVFAHNNKIKNVNNNNIKNNNNILNQKDYDESLRYLNTNTNINVNNLYKFNNNKKKTFNKNAFRKKVINTPQISLHKELMYNNKQHLFSKNLKKNNINVNDIERIYKNILDKKVQSINNNNYSTNKNYKNKISKSINNRVNTYTNYVQNTCSRRKIDNINNINNRNPLSSKYNKNEKNIEKENEKNSINTNYNKACSFNSNLRQILKTYNNNKVICNSNYNKKNINNRVINSKNNINNTNYKNTKINYNLTNANLDSNKLRSNKNSNLSLTINVNSKGNYLTSRPKSHKQNIVKSSKVLYNNYFNKKINNNVLYTEACKNPITNGHVHGQDHGRYLYNNENVKNNQSPSENDNKIIINLNILKPKIFVDNNNKHNKKNNNNNKYTTGLVKTYNNNTNVISNKKIIQEIRKQKKH